MRITNKTSISIVLGNQATERERFASEELRHYLERITGASISIAKAGKAYSDNRIILGGPLRNSEASCLIDQAAFEGLFTGGEGFIIRSYNEKTILIAGCEGDCERGTIYGVYEFLERFCGCSLSAYSHPDLAAGEWVPRIPELVLNELNYVKSKADRPFRGACVQFGDAGGAADRQLNDVFFRWLIKNRYNYVYFWMRNYESLKAAGVIEKASRFGLEFVAGHHDFLDHFLPAWGNQYFPEHYYETHPEFYRLQEDGSRYCPTDHWGQIIICCRNEELIDVISQNINDWLNENQAIKWIQISAHDGRFPQCVCPKCAPHSKAENFFYFSNEVAKRIRKVHPNVKIIQMVYSDLWECPENIDPDPNLYIVEATWHGQLRTFGKPDGTGFIGTDFDTNLMEWRRAGVRATVYDYYMGVYQNRQRYIPMADEIQAIWKHFVEKDIDGGFTQIECFNHWNNLFNFFTYGRTAYDTNLSMEDNLDRFLLIFGEGAPYVAEAIRLAENCLDGQVGIKEGGLYFLEHIDWDEIYALYEKALDAATTPVARNNIRLMRMSLRYTDLEAQQENGKYIQTGADYTAVRPYPRMDQELLYMTSFDSFWRNDPGYGIAIPVVEEGPVSDVPFDPEKDSWYRFE